MTIAEQTLATFEKYREQSQLHCLGFVLMPHHFHALLFQENNVSGVSKLMMNFKKATSVMIRKCLEQKPNGNSWLQTFEEHGQRFRPQRPRVQVWMDRYDDVAIESIKAIRTKLNYLHNNPIRSELCENPEDYPYSSARDYMENPNPWISVNCELGHSIEY